MPLTNDLKGEIIEKHKIHESDTGSSDVQVALLTERIKQLTDHVKKHSHDHSSRRGLLKLVAQRRHLLNYLTRTDPERYRALIASLGLRK
jgi:small subunit ribosomal protein S15